MLYITARLIGCSNFSNGVENNRSALNVPEMSIFGSVPPGLSRISAGVWSDDLITFIH